MTHMPVTWRGRMRRLIVGLIENALGTAEIMAMIYILCGFTSWLLRAAGVA